MFQYQDVSSENEKKKRNKIKRKEKNRNRIEKNNKKMVNVSHKTNITPYSMTQFVPLNSHIDPSCVTYPSTNAVTASARLPAYAAVFDKRLFAQAPKTELQCERPTSIRLCIPFRAPFSVGCPFWKHCFITPQTEKKKI